MSLLELTRPLRQGLAGLRRRVRSLLIVLGVSRIVVFVGIALVVYFLADYLLRLPLSVRAVFLFALLGGTAVVFVRRLLAPLATPLDDERLAARVEAAHPELQDRVKSSLAFSRAVDDPDNEDSPELMRVVVEETVRLAGSIRFQDVAHSHVAASWAVGAVALAFVLTTAAIAQAELATTFLQRSVLLRDVSWPRRTTLTVAEMTPGTPRRVTMGRETTLQIRAEGSLPDRVQFSFWEAGADPDTADRIELTPSAEDAAAFAFTLRVLTSYEFSVKGGDDDRELVYRIEALTPPAVLGIEMDATYPAYLERPAETLKGGGQRLPQGTRVRLEVRTNMPLSRATIALGAEEPAELSRAEPQLFTTELTAERNVRYSLRLVGVNGEENDPGVDTYLLQVARDQPPSVRVLTPGARSDRLAAGVVLIAFSARDDHRVTRASLYYRVNDDKERVVATGEAGGDALRPLRTPGLPPDHVRGVMAIDLTQLRKGNGKLVDKGDRLSFYFEATDSSGRKQRTRSTYRVELVTEEDLSQTIQGRQQELRESVRRADGRAHLAADRREQIKDTREDDQEFRRWTGLAQAAQARVIDDLDSVSRRVQGVLNLYVFNRLGDRSAANQILPYYERHLLLPSDRTAVPFDGRLYRGLWHALKERRIRAGDVHAKLVEMADLADRLATEHGPRAYRAIGQAATSRNEQELDIALADARAEQKTITDGLAKLSRLMREWESYEGVVRWFKALRDTEQGVVDEIKDLENGR